MQSMNADVRVRCANWHNWMTSATWMQGLLNGALSIWRLKVQSPNCPMCGSPAESMSYQNHGCNINEFTTAEQPRMELITQV